KKYRIPSRVWINHMLYKLVEKYASWYSQTKSMIQKQPIWREKLESVLKEKWNSPDILKLLLLEKPDQLSMQNSAICILQKATSRWASLFSYDSMSYNYCLL